MDALECIKTRRSVRRYTDEVISKETMNEIIDTAKMAPTWKNTQTLRYVVVSDRALIDKIKDECILSHEGNGKTLASCNTLVVLAQINGRCGYERDGSFTTSKGAGWEMFDAGIAAQTFCLAAHEKGYGTCIMGIFDDKKVAEAVPLPEGQTVAALISIGRPKFIPDPVPRKETAELVKYI